LELNYAFFCGVGAAYWVIIATLFDTALGTINPVMQRNVTEERRSILNCLDIILRLVF
jgi:hypothetical protein